MPPTLRRATAERFLFALFAAAAALMLAGYLWDLAGLRMRGWPWLAAAMAAVWMWRLPAFDGGDGAGAGELGGIAIVIAIVVTYLGWLASPALLPVTDGPDVVHHLQLIHFIQTTGRLPHDPALNPFLLEMMNYTPGSHIAVTLAANAAGLDSLRVILPVALWFVALKAAAVYLIAARLLPRGPGRPIAALAAPILLFAPAPYAIGSLYQFFFFAQAVSEAFAVGAVLAVLGWLRAARGGYPIAFAICGVGVMLSWPVYLAPIAAVVLVAVSIAPGSWRDRARDMAIALGPIGVVAALHVSRHAQGGSILAASGAVTAPSVAVFGWPFLFLAAAGLIVGARQREARPVLVFLAAIAVTAAALAIVGLRGGARSFYLPFKMVYLAIAPAAILAAVALGTATATASLGRFARASAATTVVIAALVTLPRVPAVRPASPITLRAHDAGLWARAHLNPRCVDYFSRHWLTGYWLHLDVLGNPRDSDRMRAETFEFRDTAARWIQGRGLPHAIVEDLSAIPRELRPELTVVASFPPFAVVSHPSAPCAW